MGKKGGVKKSESVSRAPISLREEATGKIQTKAITSTKSKSRFYNLKTLAVWATTNDPLIPSLGAFYGHQLAAFGEANGVPPDSSLITCQRCETVLQPGINSTVRIEKNNSKVRRKHKKSGNITQNYVVYKCHFCMHQNLKRGTSKGHLKGIYSSKDKSWFETTPLSKYITSESSKLEKDRVCNGKANEINMFPSQDVDKDITLVDSLATPSISTNTKSLMEGKKRRHDSSLSKNDIKTTNMSAKEVAKSASISNKRRRKSWTSLKEIAQSNERNSQIANLSIPFILK